MKLFDSDFILISLGSVCHSYHQLAVSFERHSNDDATLTALLQGWLKCQPDIHARCYSETAWMSGSLC